VTVSHLVGRQHLIEALKEEILGPAREGSPIESTAPLVFTKDEDAYGPFVQAGSGEEIVHRDTPLRRYGVGILYPAGVMAEGGQWTDPRSDESLPDADVVEEERAAEAEVVQPAATDAIEEALQAVGDARDDEPEELDLSGANLLKPSTIAVSAQVDLAPDSVLVVHAKGGRYDRREVKVVGKKRDWWLRSPVEVLARFPADDLLTSEHRLRKPAHAEVTGAGPLDLQVEVRSRPQGHRVALLTVCLVNRTQVSEQQALDEQCLFQATFDVTVEGSDRAASILAYPETVSGAGDEETRSMALLYRRSLTFAVGHGCAADWGDPNGEDRVPYVRAEPFPTFETPSITPDVEHDGSPLTVEMAHLAGLGDPLVGRAQLEDLISAYETWIGERAKEVADLPAEHVQAAERHVAECRAAVERMRRGLDLVLGAEDDAIARAFALANRAMLLQQLHQRPGARRISLDRATGIRFSEPYIDPDPSGAPERGRWRAFQIAFFLMSIPSIVAGDDPDRDRVELIWFPTGGGKTEAYLGLTAFSIFLRRLRDPGDSGLDVLMRYTLRLLTTQQFQRASTLLCAMETLRREDPGALGEEALTIGIWLGRSTTPNTRSDAVAALHSMQAGRDPENGFLLLRCPWCAAEMGRPLKAGRTSIVPGYEEAAGTVNLRCPDRDCPFSGPEGLPISVIDEELYERPPSLLIGTVDKFAMLPWVPKARSLFGIEPSGEHATSPPTLVIQDELHLISGPLGSLVGLYETVIEDLCTRRIDGASVRPKIVSSTATIRRYAEQVKALYGREEVSLFPPPGLDANDSFFARWARDDSGNVAPGKIYVGVHAPNLPSMMTTQVRTYASLMQAAADLPPEGRDPWWTTMSFFSSLRELGNALTLFQSDVPDYLITIRNRRGIPPDQLRKLWNVVELTGRLSSDEVPQRLQALEVTAGSRNPPALDACLASTMVEVGVDIERLSFMTVLGQPKTTSTYIQVTGRIGRRWSERPGLVVTMLSPFRPRDRSHFERFRSYHERLYAQVEPTSVTPFSPPALDRALHAVLVAYVRQRGEATQVASPFPAPTELLDEAHDLLLRRLKVVKPTEQDEFERIFTKRRSEWEHWQRSTWGRPFVTGPDALLRSSMSYASGTEAILSWPTPTSMRSVDAECLAEITQAYAVEGGGDDPG
jgi:hypothetical protein